VTNTLIISPNPLVSIFRKTRGIGYFVEALIPLALFCKEPLAITFTGITNNESDLSVPIT